MKGICILVTVAAVIALLEAATCPSNISGDGLVFIPHDSDCHKYYECTTGGTPVERSCPTNRENIQFCFDKTRLICVAPSEAPGCCDGPDPNPNPGDCPCSTGSKCVMHYDDANVEVCIKKNNPTVTPTHLKWLQ